MLCSDLIAGCQSCWRVNRFWLLTRGAFSKVFCTRFVFIKLFFISFTFFGCEKVNSSRMLTPQRDCLDWEQGFAIIQLPRNKKSLIKSVLLQRSRAFKPAPDYNTRLSPIKLLLAGIKSTHLTSITSSRRIVIIWRKFLKFGRYVDWQTRPSLLSLKAANFDNF